MILGGRFEVGRAFGGLSLGGPKERRSNNTSYYKSGDGNRHVIIKLKG